MPKITFIGAGSAVFTRNLLADIMSYSELSGSEICLMDIDQQRLGLVDALARKMVAQQSAKIKISSTTDLRQALTNADYVVITIQVGGLDAYALDIEIPKKYGIEQCVGDTLGPGGIFRGLRHMAVISEICRELEEVSPHALILQYTNPMAMICRSIQANSSISSVGLCHSVQGTSKMLARFIGAPPEEITYWVAGINHMAWFLRFEWKGRDAYHLLFEKLNDPELYGQEPVRFEMMRHFGYFVTESSSHMSEYVPYFRKNPEEVKDLVDIFEKSGNWKFNYGRTGGYLISCQKKVKEYFTWFDEQLTSENPIEIQLSHEYGAQIIHAITTNTPYKINGNVANHGIIPNLPQKACVEVPCLVDASGIHPCYVGELPEQLAALNRTNISVQELAVQGHLQKDPSFIYQAVKLDPLTAASCSLPQIDGMVKEMFAAQRQWLPQFQ